MRYPGAEENERPYPNWHHLALGLCLEKDTDISEISKRSFYSNIDSVSTKHHEFCSTFQVTEDSFSYFFTEKSKTKDNLLVSVFTNSFISKLQKDDLLLKALDDYYSENTAEYKLDRGHLLPNSITNYDPVWQKTTFTLTNAAPQVTTVQSCLHFF